MNPQLRDTQLGRLVRLLSGHKRFGYPDEVDPTFLKYALQQRENSTPVNGHAKKDAVPNSTLDSDGSEGHAMDGVSAARTNASRSLENGKDVCLVDWYGPEDLENPQNWSRNWKILVTFQICILNFSFYLGSSIYVPGELSIIEDFGVSEVVATLGLSLFTAGYGLGPMLWSPMSEIATLGRSPIYFWTNLAFVLLQLPTGYAVNMPMFLFFRFLAGFVGCPALATGGATISDMYDPATAAYGICIMASFGICGPVFGPLVGGFTAQAKGWRWTIWVLTWASAAVQVVLFFLLPETSGANILYRRAKRLRKSTGDERLRSQSEIDDANHGWRDRLVVLGRAFTLTFSEPIVFFTDLYTALLYGVLFLWFESFPIVFGEIYRFNTGMQGLVFLGIFVGGIVTVPCYLLWVKHGVVPKFTKPNFKPEMVLPPTFFGAVSLPICLFWYGWSARRSVHWIMPVIGSSFFTVGLVTLFNAVLNYLAMSYPRYVASIFAGNALFRASFGAIFPLFARQLFRNLGIGPGNSLLGGIAICFIPIPYIFYKHGGRIRQVSKNALHDA